MAIERSGVPARADFAEPDPRSAFGLEVAAGILLIGIVLTAAPGALAAPGDFPGDDAYYARAEVLSVSPRYGWREVSEPVERCVYVEPDRYSRRYHEHYQRDRHDRERGRDGDRLAAGIVGGLVGGLVGNQFGGGDGRKALTVLGALVGASVAREHVRDREHARWPSDRRFASDGPEDHLVRRCTTTEHARRERGIQGYDVTYRYQGVTLHKWMNEHPGDTVRVRVAVEPLDQPMHSAAIH